MSAPYIALAIAFGATLFLGVGILARNHYKGRPSRIPEAERIRYLEEQNGYLAAQNKLLLETLHSLKAVLDSKVSLAGQAASQGVTENTEEVEPTVFINPMSSDSSMERSFTDLGEVKEEKVLGDPVDRLRRLLGK